MDGIRRFIALVLSVFNVLGMAAEGVPYMFQPTLAIDATNTLGDVSSRASGFLYGIAEAGVPDAAITESIDISSVSQKVIGGLQHPIGDVDDVAGQLDNCDYIVVYLQDCFDTWYYCNDEIMEMRKNGTYDCKAFVEEKFYPLVREKVTALSNKDYSSRIVYCPYNECDNGVWFGTFIEDGFRCSFDDAGKQNFYDAWCETYKIIRSINPNALIGGPGYCDYNAEELNGFLTYCNNNSCVPDIMIYHELSDTSSLLWQEHTAEYREIEKSLGISERPVIVTEYGCMFECGVPGDMLRYIIAIEKSGTYGNVAFWRLANNLCDTTSDANSPNSNWWLYRWYADMEGKLLNTKIVDILHSDFANAIKYKRDSFRYLDYTGMASITSDGKKLEVICGGSDYTGYINIKNLCDTKLNDKVNVKVECVYYEGLSGMVSSPTLIKQYTDKVFAGKLKIKLEDMDKTAVYHITVTAANEKTSDYFNENLPVRYEFENGTLLGNSYTYDSAYATTGLVQGMVGGIEKSGDGVSVTVTAPKSGKYILKVIYGKANDGVLPNDRVDATAIIKIDGNSEAINFENTIKSEYTSELCITKYLEAGTHSIDFLHSKGTYVLDSMLLLYSEDNITPITVMPDADRSVNGVTSFLAVAPENGFYAADFGSPVSFSVDGAKSSTVTGKPIIYLRKGLNYIDINSKNAKCELVLSEQQNIGVSVKPSEMLLSGEATLLKDFNGNQYIGDFSANESKAELSFTASKDGAYRVTVLYSNNAEGGTHAYNVDLIESSVCVTVGNSQQIVMCRNTYSETTYKTVTFNAELKKGENTFKFECCNETGNNSSALHTPNIAEISINPVAFDGTID